MTAGRARRHALAALALLALLGACGQKGALYLPQKPQPVEEQDQATTAPPPDEAQ
jgi:predicted small lipoprotein YifL